MAQFLNYNSKILSFKIYSLSLHHIKQIIMKLIEINLKSIFELCKIYNVKTLSVFGSILTNRFNDSSDIDMIVEFNNEDIDDYVSNYFNFKDALTALFKREVDLLEAKGIKNRFLLQNINRTKQVIYG